MVIINKIVEYVKDKYLTWRTGKTKSEREWNEWYNKNVDYKAYAIKDMFSNFKHILVVDFDKFCDLENPFDYVPCKDAEQYFWPARSIDNCAIWRIESVRYDRALGEWVHSYHFDYDYKIFVATNNDHDALMIALKYGE